MKSKVFIDANVIIDLFDSAREHHKTSGEAIKLLIEQGTELYTTCDLITTVYYVLAKRNRKKALEAIEKSMGIFKLIDFSNSEVLEAVKLVKEKEFKDLEDTLQYLLAKKAGCTFILTRDTGFVSPDLKVIRPETVQLAYNSQAKKFSGGNSNDREGSGA